MTAPEHNKTIGLLFFIMGIIVTLLCLAGAVASIVIGGAIIANERRFNDDAAGGLAIIIGGVIGCLFGLVIFGIIPLIAGGKMRKQKKGAKTWGIIAAIAALFFMFPIGTAIGIYALWFLLSDQGKNLYNSSGATGGFNAPPPNNWR